MRVSVVVGVVVLATACKVDTEIRAQEPPVLSDAGLSTDEDNPVTVTLDGSDPSGDAVTYTVTSEPLHGDVVIDGDVLTYTPDPDYHGDDALTVLPTAARLDGEVATVSITVNPVNDAPTVEDFTGTLLENESHTGQLIASDIDSEVLTFAIETDVQNGVLTVLESGALTYTPDRAFDGTDTFTFTVSDGEASTTGTGTFTVNDVDAPPVASDSAVTLDEDTSTSGTLMGSDPDGDAVVFAIVTPPSYGTLVIDDAATGAFTYTPDADYAGSDSATFRLTANGLASSDATLAITVDPINDAPVTSDVSLTVDEDMVLTTNLAATDIDSAVLTWTAEQPANGTVTVSGDVLTYTPPPNFSTGDGGPVVVPVTVSDGTLTGTATVSIAVTPVNDPPVAEDDTYTAVRNLELSIPATDGLLANDTDLEGDSVRVSAVAPTSAMGGTVSRQEDGAFTYRIGPGALGTDTFTYTLTDDNGGEATGTVSIELTESFRVVGAAGSTGPWVAPVDNTLQAAADASLDGETIYVLANIPADTSRVTLPSSVRLLGQALPLVIDGQTLVNAGDTPVLGTTLRLNADGTEVAGLEVDVSSSAVTTARADIDLHDLTIRAGVHRCVSATGATRLTITDVDMAACGTGIDADDSSITLRRVSITTNATGIEVQTGGRDLQIYDSSIDAGSRALLWVSTDGELRIQDVDLRGRTELFLSGPTDVEISQATMVKDTSTALQISVLDTAVAEATLTDVEVESDRVYGAFSLRVADSAELTAQFTNVDVVADLATGVDVRVAEDATAQLVFQDSSMRAWNTPFELTTYDSGSVELALQNVVATSDSPEPLRVTSSGAVSPRVGMQNVESNGGFRLRAIGSAIELGDTTPVGTAGTNTDGGALVRTGNTTNGGGPGVSVDGEVVLIDLLTLPGMQ